MRNHMKKLLLPLLLVASAIQAHSQGTIAFGNSALTRFTINGSGAFDMFSFGVFVNGSEQPVSPLGISSTASLGIIVASSVYAIPGTEPLQVVSMQIKGWDARFASYDAARAGGAFYGATDVRQITLGPTAGPGTVIWQTATGTNPNRFFAAVMIPEPSTTLLGGTLIGLMLLLRRGRNPLS
jgi:hypothetical protein